MKIIITIKYLLMEGRNSDERAPGHPEEGEDIPGVRAGSADGARAEAQAGGVLPRRLRVSQGGRRQGDVHHQERQAGRRVSGRDQGLRDAGGRRRVWRTLHPQRARQ